MEMNLIILFRNGNEFDCIIKKWKWIWLYYLVMEMNLIILFSNGNELDYIIWKWNDILYYVSNGK